MSLITAPICATTTVFGKITGDGDASVQTCINNVKTQAIIIIVVAVIVLLAICLICILVPHSKELSTLMKAKKKPKDLLMAGILQNEEKKNTV